MSIVWILIKIAVQVYLLNVIFRQSYNWVFLVLKEPILWILLVALVGIGYVFLAFELSWDPRIVGWATAFVVFLNWPPSIPKSTSKEEIAGVTDMAHVSWEIGPGRLKYRLGLILFAVCSALAHLLLFTELCAVGGQCSSL